MPWTEDLCTPTRAHCIILTFKNFCLDKPLTKASLQGTIRINNLPGNSPLLDTAGNFILNCPTVQTLNNADLEEISVDGCSLLAVKTCALPANVDSGYDPEDPTSINHSLGIPDSYYTISVTAGGKRIEHSFQIDAAANYNEMEGCIPLTEIVLDGSLPLPEPEPGNPLYDAVCKALENLEYAGELPTDGSVNVVGVDNSGECKLYTIEKNCTDEDRLEIANILGGQG